MLSDRELLRRELADERSGSGIPQVHYSNIEEFVQDLERSYDNDSSMLFVYGVSASVFNEVDERRENDNCKYRFALFLPEAELLIVKFPSAPHEAMIPPLIARIETHFNGGRDDWPWFSCGATQYPGRSELAGASQGDCGGGPEWARGGPGQWPTLMIEVGWSQTLPTLRRIMKWWFSTSNHQVKIVLLISFERRPNQHGGYERAVIEKWIEIPPTMPSGVLTRARAASSTPTPTLQQRNVVTYTGPDITVENMDDISLDDFRVTRDDMVLEFSTLMLREPQDASEGDLVLTAQFLKQCALKALRRSVMD